MKLPEKISAVFPKHLFWDMDMDKLDVQRDKDIIIPRALFMSNAKTFTTDIEKLENLYSTADIVNNLKSTKELISNKVCKMVADRYHISVFQRFSLK